MMFGQVPFTTTQIAAILLLPNSAHHRYSLPFVPLGLHQPKQRRTIVAARQPAIRRGHRTSPACRDEGSNMRCVRQ
jgi:hypothetical protein